MKHMVHQAVSQYYKVYEKSMIIPCKGYKIEGKNKFDFIPQMNGKVVLSSSSSTTNLLEGLISPLDNKQYNASIVEHMDQQAHWFRTYFIHQTYATFCGYNDENEPVLITAMYDSIDHLYRVITRLKQGPSIRDVIQDSFLLSAPLPQHHHNASSVVDDDQSIHNETTTAEPIIPDTTWKAVIESSSAAPLIDIPFHRLKKMNQCVMKSNGLEDDTLKLDENGVIIYYYIYGYGLYICIYIYTQLIIYSFF